MSVATDDVHDLFDRDEDDEPDGSTDEEGADGSDGSADWDELSSLGDGESPVDPAQEETTESTTMAFEGPVEDGADESEPAESAGDVHDFFDADRTEEPDGSATGSSGRSDGSVGSEPGTERSSLEGEQSGKSVDSDRHASTGSTTPGEADTAGGGFESDVSTTSSGDVAEDDAADSEPAEPGTTSPESPVEDAADPSESSGSTTPSPDEPADGDHDDVESTASTTPSADGSVDGDARESGAESVSEPESATGSTTATEEPPEDGGGGSEPVAAPTAREESSAEDRREPEPGGATASTDGTVADDHGTSESHRATTVADGSTAVNGSAATDGSTATDEPSVAAGHGGRATTGPDEPGSASSAVDDGVASAASGSNRLPTGIDELDRAMGGGIPPGRLVVLVADPGVQSELIVDRVLAQRDTLFVTTDRPDWEVMRDIEPGLGSGQVVVQEHTPDSLLSGLDSLLDDLGTSSNFVLDSVNELELVPRKRYRIFLSDVKRQLFDTGSVGLFTGVTVGHESARDLTLRRADVVLRLETRTTDHEIENRLSVPKFRGGAALTETVKLELTDEVRVDTG